MAQARIGHRERGERCFATISHWMARAIALLGIACVSAGCGASQRDEVQAKVEQFVHATADRDYLTLCQQVLAPSLVTRLSAAGIACPQAMRVFVASVQHPTLSIGPITVKGERASAIVLTAASGQRPALTSIELINTKHGWRLTSLAAPR